MVDIKFFKMEIVHLVIKGKVQGVYFRASARDVANKLGIKGWIKNRPDKNVEALATGSKEQLDKFIEWCHKGPPMADVKEVIVSVGVEQSLPPNFIIK